MKRLITIAVLLLCTMVGFSQNVSVKGRTVNAKGKTIEIYKDADKFSKQEQLLDSYTICSLIPVPPFNFPFGGGITIAGMLPIILIAYLYGTRWGLLHRF